MSQPQDFDQYDFLSVDSSGELEIDPLAGSGAFCPAQPPAAGRPGPPMPPASGPFATVSIRCAVNGEPVEVPEIWVADSLLFVLRDRLGRTAAKDGCGEGECGACVVLLDGEPVLACLTPALVAEGSAVTTARGVRARATRSPPRWPRTAAPAAATACRGSA